jgi:hypothetical protein
MQMNILNEEKFIFYFILFYLILFYSFCNSETWNLKENIFKYVKCVTLVTKILGYQALLMKVSQPSALQANPTHA